MASLLLMPSLSPTMESGVISAWRKQPGEHVDVGEVLAEIETDKAVMEWEMADEGVVRQILVQPGLEIKVGTPIAILAESAEEDITALIAQAAQGAPAAPPAAAPKAAPPVTSVAPASKVAPVTPHAAPSVSAAPKTAAAPAVAPAPAAAGLPRRNGDRIKISPYGRKLAEQQGVEWQALQGTGPSGRIIARDVEAAISSGSAARGASQRPAVPPAAIAPAAAGSYEDQPLSMMRKAIARRMAESKQTVPHFQARRKVRAEKLLEAREAFKRDYPDLKITVNDLLIKACAMAIRQHPAINSQFLGDHIRRFHGVDMAVAVGTDEGLITPVLRGADGKGLAEISAEMKALAEAARARKLKPEDYTGGTFTLSNLGMYGITEFNAIINPPQACILAVSGVVREPVAEGDKLAVGQTMNLTLSSDHRVVDGVAAAKFLDTLARMVENPLALLL